MEYDFSRTKKLYDDFLNKDDLSKIESIEISNPVKINFSCNFISICPHEYIPFNGKIYIEISLNKKTLGFSEYEFIVKELTKDIILQEELNNKIIYFFNKLLLPKEIVVKIKSYHSCKHFYTSSPEKVVTEMRINNEN